MQKYEGRLFLWQKINSYKHLKLSTVHRIMGRKKYIFTFHINTETRSIQTISLYAFNNSVTQIYEWIK